MKLRGVIYIVAAILLGVFVLANWALLSGPVELHLLVANVQAPLGILILLVAAVIILVDLGVHALTQRAWVRERQSLSKDLEGARARAEREEESRTGALRAAMERELATIRSQLDQVLAGQSALLRQAKFSDTVDSPAQSSSRVRSSQASNARDSQLAAPSS